MSLLHVVMTLFTIVEHKDYVEYDVPLNIGTGSPTYQYILDKCLGNESFTRLLYKGEERVFYFEGQRMKDDLIITRDFNTIPSVNVEKIVIMHSVDLPKVLDCKGNKHITFRGCNLNDCIVSNAGMIVSWGATGHMTVSEDVKSVSTFCFGKQQTVTIKNQVLQDLELLNVSGMSCTLETNDDKPIVLKKLKICYAMVAEIICDTRIYLPVVDIFSSWESNWYSDVEIRSSEIEQFFFKESKIPNGNNIIVQTKRIKWFSCKPSKPVSVSLPVVINTIKSTGHNQEWIEVYN